jgi:hypothetical protein
MPARVPTQTCEAPLNKPTIPCCACITAEEHKGFARIEVLLIVPCVRKKKRPEATIPSKTGEDGVAHAGKRIAIPLRSRRVQKRQPGHGGGAKLGLAVLDDRVTASDWSIGRVQNGVQVTLTGICSFLIP